jgi:putative membrane protein
MKLLQALAVVAGGLGAVPLMAGAADSTSADESFYEDAAQSNLAEVEQGRLAQVKGQSQSVKDFGAMMVKEHSAANDKLRELVSRKGVELPGTSGVRQESNKAKLDVLSGDFFDKSYIKGMIKAHRSDIEAFKIEVSAGHDPDGKRYAAAMLPTLEEHLRNIEQIAKSYDISTD